MNYNGNALYASMAGRLNSLKSSDSDKIAEVQKKANELSAEVALLKSQVSNIGAELNALKAKVK